MQSTASNVSTYMDEIPAERKFARQKLCALCRDMRKFYPETMKYLMPSPEKNGVTEVPFNSQKNYIPIDILKRDVMDRCREMTKAASTGKGCIIYSKPEKIERDVRADMLVISQ